MSEWFDKVDLNDLVIGRVSRHYAHLHGVNHRAVHLFIQDQESKWVIQKRSSIKDLEPNLWTTSCSGHVDSCENYTHAAIRECKEELGIVLAKQNLVEILRCSPCEETGMEFIRVYFVNVKFDSFFTNKHEVEKLEVYELSSLRRKCMQQEEIFSKSFLHIFKLAYSKLCALQEG